MHLDIEGATLDFVYEPVSSEHTVESETRANCLSAEAERGVSLLKMEKEEKLDRTGLVAQ